MFFIGLKRARVREFTVNGDYRSQTGLHVGILFSIYERISKGRTSPGSIAVLAFLLYTCGVLACWKPSIVRAEIMIVMKTIARAKELRYDSLTSLSFAALILILRNPYVIHGNGFQMSFLAIMAMDIVLRMINGLRAVHVMKEQGAA